jgi:group I intron endonuclease
MKISGIYKIQSKVKPDRIYIGSGCDIRQRWRHHLSDLRHNDHHTIKLQRHFNKYGEADLVFIIIEPCFKEFLIIREQFYFDQLNPYFNSSPTAGNCLGVKHTDETRKRMSHYPSVETRIKISEGAKGNKNWLGKHRSKDTKLKLRLANLGKIQSIEIRLKRSLSMKGKNSGPKSLEHIKHMKEAQILRRLKNKIK